MPNYQKSTCFCIICKKEYSTKGIFTHYIIAHTQAGKERHQQNVIKYNTPNGNCAIANKAKAAKNRAESTITYCKHCNSPLDYKKRKNTFCSPACSKHYNDAHTVRNHTQETKSKIKQARINAPKQSKISYRNCIICNKLFIWHHNKSGPNRCCSTTCLQIHRSNKARINPGLGTKRSKLEIELFELCKSHFNTVLSNYKIIDNWDADIVIPEYKIAILWNGPWHYKEMHIGNHSLKQVQNRDKIKIKLFNSINWNVFVFEDRHYTPQSAFEHILKWWALLDSNQHYALQGYPSYEPGTLPIKLRALHVN